MANSSTPKNPRLVIYLTKPEMRAAKAAAVTEGHKNPHRWAAQILRKQLNQQAVSHV